MATVIKGLKFEKDANGKAQKAIFDLNIFGEQLEDIIDGILADARKEESGITVEEFVKKQNKKKGAFQEQIKKTYQVIVQKSAQKEIDRLPDYVYTKAIKAILGLKENPFPRGFKKLTGRENEYRIKVGEYRISYSINNAQVIIFVFRVRHRKDVYRKD